MSVTSRSGRVRGRTWAQPVAVLPQRSRDAAESALIVHADDFGETVEVTAGIRQGIEAGRVTSTSIMANMPATAHALRLVASLADRASFGVHLNLCEGRPLTQGRSLTDGDGHFHGKRALISRAVAGVLSLPELQAEITAQLALVRDAGVRISHLDGHKHLHQLPQVSTAVANVLPRFAIERVRITRARGLASLSRPATFLRELAARRAARLFERARLRSPVRVIDIRTLMADGVTNRTAPPIVDRAGVVELCCHPGTKQADAQRQGSHDRSAELRYLLSPRFRELLISNRVRLVSYWDV